MSDQLDIELSENPFDGKTGATLSSDGLYRYMLWRNFDLYPKKAGSVTWVMLNPSTADEHTDDATVRRCVGFTRRWGYGGLTVVNVYAYRSTDPKAMFQAHRDGADIEGPLNEQAINGVVVDAGLVVAAWGANGSGPMVDKLTEWLRSKGAMCLGHTRAGAPRHPVRLAYATKLVPL